MRTMNNFKWILVFSALALFLVGGLVSCGGGGSASGPVQVQAPTTLIQDFIAKHETMVDKALVDFYAPDERPMIAASVEKNIEEKRESGELEKLQNAVFDFSNLDIKVVDEKEATYRDMPTKVIKVSVTGSYVMKQEDAAKTIPADQTIILEMVDNDWKVTEKTNPFKEYQYKKRS